MRKDEILSGLDDQQKIAAQHLNGKALIIAGAGSGKTTTLIRRIAYLIDQGIDPKTILLLTFTKNAANSIINRARAFCNEAEFVYGGTFHSVAARLIRENSHIFNLPKNFTIIDPEDSENIIKQLFLEVPKQEEEMYPRTSMMQNVISLSINKKQSVLLILEDLYPEYIEHDALISDIKKNYSIYKAKYDLLDYDDLLVFWAALVQDKNIGDLFRKRFPHVMIDEHQDSNRLQLDIIYGLGGEYNQSLVTVGDPLQVIFGFRGSARSYV